MAEAVLYMFDDATARSWQPFALTRPAAELMLGAYTFRRRAELVFGLRCGGTIAEPHLQGFEEPDAAPVVAAEGIDASAPRLFLSSRVVFDWGQQVELPSGRATVLAGDRIVGLYVPAGAAPPEPAWFLDPQPEPGESLVLAGRVLERVWDLVAENPEQITRDIAAAPALSGSLEERSFESVGYREGALRLGERVTIEPGVVLDFSDGPIWLDDDVTVRAFTRLAGPAYAGRGSTLLGGPYSAISLGPMCKVHGEMEETVVLGYSNKAHDGFLGHAYLGRWVNLGAMTTNSDLKNNYGSIRMWTPAGDADTGLLKLGCLLGDHVKTGIGALLNTGTVIGAGTNIFGSDMPPKYVPPFSWGSGSELVAFDVEKFLALAQTVAQRRHLTLSDGMREVLRRAWHIGRNTA